MAGLALGVAVEGVCRHGEQVGSGAALPVIFWRSPGRAAGLTRGGVVLTVNGDRSVVERQLAGGELACPGCGGVLGGWGEWRASHFPDCGSFRIPTGKDQ